METDLLYEMIMLAEMKNYARAAEQLYISQSSLSRHISSLEEKLDVQLFERNPRQVKLTRYGEAFIPFAKRIIDLEAEGTKALEIVRHREQKSIRIGTIHGLSDFGVMKKITGFIAENPDIAVDLKYAENTRLKEMLESDEVDLIIFSREEMAEKDKLKTLRLSEDRIVVVLPEDHPLKNRKTISISDLDGEEWILQEDNRLITGIIRDIARKSSIKIKESKIHVAGVGTLELVQQGLGIALEQQKTAYGHNAQGLVYIPLEPERKIWIGLGWKENSSSVVSLFIDNMRRKVRNR